MGQDTAVAAPPRTADRRRALGFFAICLGNFVIMLDTNIVNLAIPHIQGSLGGTFDNLLWVVNGYTLAVAALILSGGAVGDRLGNDRAYRIGAVGFAVTSLLCGVAPNLGVLILCRVLQGATAALLLPPLLALIPHLYQDPAGRARAVAVWGSTGAVALAAGPLVAGIFIDTLGWRAIFAVNVPICLAVYLLVGRTVDPVPRGTRTRIDLWGQFLTVVVLGALAFALMEGPAYGWTSPPIVTAGVLTLLAVPVLVLVERRSDHPLIPPRLFRHRGFTVAAVNGLVFQFVFFGTLFLLAIYLQTAHRTSALDAGLRLLPITIATALAPPLLTSRLMVSRGLRVPVYLAATAGIPGFLIMLFSDATSPYWLLGVALTLQGLWSGLALPPTASLAVATSPVGLSGTGSGVFNAARQLGGVLGVAVLGATVSHPGSVVDGMHTSMIIAAVGVAVLTLLARFATVPTRASAG